jgi:hypothetical protein
VEEEAHAPRWDRSKGVPVVLATPKLSPNFTDAPNSGNHRPAPWHERTLAPSKKNGVATKGPTTIIIVVNLTASADATPPIILGPA